MPGAGTDKTKKWRAGPAPIVVLVEPQLGEIRRGRARHGEFRSGTAAFGQAAAALAERQSGDDGGRC